MHYAAGLSKTMAHDEFEDTDVMRLMLEYNGDTNIPTKMVNIANKVFLRSSLSFFKPFPLANYYLEVLNNTICTH